MFKRFLSGARSAVPAPAASAVLVELNAPKESSALNRSRERSALTQVFRTALVVILAILAFGASSAFAASAASHLVVHSRPLPTRFSAGDNEICEKYLTTEKAEANQGKVPPCDGYQVTVTNTGSVTAPGPIVITDALPAGVKVPATLDEEGQLNGFSLFYAPNHPEEQSAGQELYPKWEEEGTFTSFCAAGAGRESVTCEFSPSAGQLHPYQRLEMDVFVVVEAGAAPAANTVSVSEGGTQVAAVSESDSLSTESPPFGPSALVSEIAGVDGLGDTQAGDHPYALTTRVDMTTRMGVNSADEYAPTDVAWVRDVVVDLPLGFVGSAVATPKCTLGELQSPVESETCPLDTLVGHITSETKGLVSVSSDIYNMVTEHGVAAEFGFKDALHNTHVIDASVAPTPTGYVTRAVARETPQLTLTNFTTTFYGDPGLAQQEIAGLEGLAPKTAAPSSMFTNPEDCSGEQLKTQLFVDSWQHPGAFNADGTPDVEGPGWVGASTEAPPVTGCDQLSFAAESFTFAPEAAHSGADEPAGYESVLKIPQSRSETPGILATPPLKTTVVTLPAGTSISPSAANGLVGCQETGPEGIEFNDAGPGHCPEASKVGTVEVQTPVLEERLSEGSVYVAQPSCGGSGQPECSEALAEEGKLFAIYLEISSKARGVHIKLRGKVEVGGNGHRNGLAPGQIRTSFIETPQMPFSELRFKFDGGQRAPLANPQSCGTFTTNASLEPWSAPESGPNAVEQPTFNIGGCGNGFAPSFSAGTTNSEAGAYSAFTLTLGRQDREQDLSGVTVNMPPGLIGKVAGIPQCGEAQANAGTCSAASQIGTATGAAGSGSEPLYQSGPVYLTGPYRGAPFGLSVVVPANAGPYHLGNIVVRAAISVNPTTAAITVTSNPLPQSIDGVPLRLKTVNVTVGTQNNFTFNATDCSAQSVSATLTSAQGATAPVSSAYQPTGCTGMKFAPVFSASTAGRATKASGASLDVKVTYPNGPAGTYANIKSVKVDLPKQLPSRLTTLQKACLAKVFEANPANCPPDADVGTATATTPLLNVPVSGPAYLVSHGNEAFPDLEIVLQGEGITLILDGNTLIKNGITSSTFKSIPDAPVSSFELKLPTKKFSILGSNVPEKDKFSLCGQSLSMPTEITAQNGAVIKQTTKIGITGCPPTRPKAKKAKAAKRAKKASKSTRRGK